MRYKNPYLYDRDTIEHGWATKAEERAYNREYYQKHKEELLRKAREAREGIQRTAQNAYNTARREAQGIRDAKREFDSAMTKARSAVEDAGRYLEKTYKNAQTRSQQRKQAKGYKLASDLSAIPGRIVDKMYSDRNKLNEFYRNNPDAREDRNKLNRWRRQYGTAANEAAKASMTRAQKEALKKREEAKRRMQKWFKR